MVARGGQAWAMMARSAPCPVETPSPVANDAPSTHLAPAGVGLPVLARGPAEVADGDAMAQLGQGHRDPVGLLPPGMAEQLSALVSKQD